MIACHLSTGNSSIGATCWMPALLTRTSTAPNSAIAFSDHGLDLVGLAHVGAVVAHGDAMIRGDPGAQRLDVVGRPKPFSTILAPSAANASAMPRPMPLVDPVTRAVLPFSIFSPVSRGQRLED